MIKKMIDLALVKAEDAKIFEITDDLQKVVDAANKIGHPKISENFYDGFKEARAIAEKVAKDEAAN